MTDSRIGCGVIGAGWWGTTAHIPALKRNRRANLLVVQGADGEQIAKVATDFGVPLGTESVDEALAVPGLLAVIISSTPNVHYSQAKAALEARKHVLIEKPMTLTVAQSNELVLLAKQHQLHFLVSCPWHYTEHSRTARQLIQAGALGQMKMISVLMTNFTLGLYQGKPWDQVFGDHPAPTDGTAPHVTPGRLSYSDPAVAGGGQIYSQVSHVAAYLGFLTGRRPAEVFARFDDAGTKVDVYNSLSLKLDDGTLVSLASHGAAMLSDRQYEIRIYGTEGMILQDLWKGTMEFHDLQCNVTRYPVLPADKIYPMFRPTDNLIDLVAGQGKNESPAELGLFAMEVIEGAICSSKSGTNIKIQSVLKSTAVV